MSYGALETFGRRECGVGRPAHSSEPGGIVGVRRRAAHAHHLVHEVLHHLHVPALHRRRVGLERGLLGGTEGLVGGVERVAEGLGRRACPERTRAVRGSVKRHVVVLSRRPNRDLQHSRRLRKSMSHVPFSFWQISDNAIQACPLLLLTHQ